MEMGCCHKSKGTWEAKGPGKQRLVQLVKWDIPWDMLQIPYAGTINIVIISTESFQLLIKLQANFVGIVFAREVTDNRNLVSTAY
jgi:hypothetical protein